MKGKKKVIRVSNRVFVWVWVEEEGNFALSTLPFRKKKSKPKIKNNLKIREIDLGEQRFRKKGIHQINTSFECEVSERKVYHLVSFLSHSGNKVEVRWYIDDHCKECILQLPI